MKRFNGKAIYNPQGKAGEYSNWGCNFYVGCSNMCQYCYCKKGILAKVMGMDHPQLKKCFKNEDDAIMIFQKELMQNINEIKKTGLFFTFTSDPFLPETLNLTWKAVSFAYRHGVICQLLTKRADFLDKLDFSFLASNLQLSHADKIWFGFTLTGCDELEPNASTNWERIQAMKFLHKVGFKTWASIEPLISIQSSWKMINDTIGFCDTYKIGLLSGEKNIDKKELIDFVNNVNKSVSARIYWKNSIRHYLKNENI